jgi:hypothetical protein
MPTEAGLERGLHPQILDAEIKQIKTFLTRLP